MKNLFITLALCALTVGVQAQEKSKGQKAESKKETKKPMDHGEHKAMGHSKTFIDRYYAIKGAYKDMPETYGPFAASDHDMEKFVERYHGLKDGYAELASYAALYAGSNQDAKEFEKKYHEAKASSAELSPVLGEFAASKNDLKEFTTRYHEIKAAHSRMGQKVYGAYAGSKIKLEDFISRLNEIKESYPKEEQAFEFYAAASNPLQKKNQEADSKKKK